MQPNRHQLPRRSFLQKAGMLGASFFLAGPGELSAKENHPMNNPASGKAAAQKMIEVSTSKGTLGGLLNEQTGVLNFKGIPYAQSIAGSNRFRPPQPVKPWSGSRPALRFSDSSPQQSKGLIGPSPVTPAFTPPDYVHPGDDCLALNVWAPKGADGSLPVMVWLHGGGWTSDSGTCKIYDGENLASRGDVVVVTVNHRLGASGLTDFSRLLGGEFADSSNLSIRDLVAALEWVRDEISAFGGNPNLVTIFGESGGGWKVSTLLGTPSAQGLFHRAIIQSGPLTRFATQEQADEVAKIVLSELGLTAETAHKLNELSWQEVVTAEAKVLAEIPMMGGAPGFPTGFWPVLDGEFLPRHVFDPDAAPSSRDVPLLIGQTGTEFTLFMLGDKDAYTMTEANLEKRVESAFGKEDAPKILQSYRRDFPDYDPSGLWFRLYSDFAMGALTSAIQDVRSKTGAAPVYAYRFNWQTPLLKGKLYSPHTIEIPFVFDNVNTETGSIVTGGGEEVARLADTVSTAWVEFARTGRPSAPNLPEWPVFSPEERRSMHIDTTSEVRPYIDSEILEIFWSKLSQQAKLPEPVTR